LLYVRIHDETTTLQNAGVETKDNTVLVRFLFLEVGEDRNTGKIMETFVEIEYLSEHTPDPATASATGPAAKVC
jgi:hypothetical protein